MSLPSLVFRRGLEHQLLNKATPRIICCQTTTHHLQVHPELSSIRATRLLHSSSQTSSHSPARIISTPSITESDLPSFKSIDGSSSSQTPNGIIITPSALQQIEKVRKQDNESRQVLRLSVESGGCHGFQYKMEFTDLIEPDDFVFTSGERDYGVVVIDVNSLELMDGSTLDFSTELIGSSFKILHNPRSAGKGCGCGVSWELK